ncbi:MAG: sigma-70 family RNA polymerase sigma factor [Oscillospiraceae bacterium]|nr:sigma-70 family RNA polymerase sigma factor [Oscillospiraceae bacterium]
MDDNMILDLYFKRSETAVGETARKYGSYCLAIALNILGNKEDAEECVNDTYYKAWEAIPPQNPPLLRAFLGKITRNLSLNKYKSKHTQKRGGNLASVFEELEQCLPAASPNSVEDEFDAKEAGKLISAFLRAEKEESRVIFIRRYWYGDSTEKIAQRFQISQSKVKSTLFRTRGRLKLTLEKGGVVV